MGLLAVRQRRREDAESLFRKSLEMRQTWYGLLHPLVAEIVDALATLLCMDSGESPDLSQSEDLYRNALHMREILLGKSHLEVACTLSNLGKKSEV